MSKPKARKVPKIKTDAVKRFLKKMDKWERESKKVILVAK